MEQTNTSEQAIPLSEKYMLTIREACFYFNIGDKKIRRLAEDNLGIFSVRNGNRYLVIRPKFEKFLNETSTL
ncbi:MAG: DNA-binding protein [Oscillospiraceae bacterium]|nr:DNA-binding protein [Oscillospiraceae bacterium]